VAAGDISPVTARALSVVLGLVALIVTLLVSPALAGIVALYLAMMTVYTVWLRRIAFVDIVVIALGFVLRALAGAVAVSVPLSAWLFACTFLLAVFLGLGKRRHELRMLHGHTERHRPSLAGYARINLDHAIVAVGVLTTAAYVFYAFAVPTFGRALPMFLTVPFVVVAIGRYLYLVLRRNLGGSPEALLFRDRPLLASIVAWSASVAVVLVS
jgi:4-hydroxybenzoate polyprenyltransferase